jgi:hypothetical protein
MNEEITKLEQENAQLRHDLSGVQAALQEALGTLAEWKSNPHQLLSEQDLQALAKYDQLRQLLEEWLIEGDQGLYKKEYEDLEKRTKEALGK